MHWDSCGKVCVNLMILGTIHSRVKIYLNYFHLPTHVDKAQRKIPKHNILNIGLIVGNGSAYCVRGKKREAAFLYNI